MHPVSRWSRIAKAYISFGQGISVTPLQLANAFAALANGGVVHQPYLVRAIGRDGAVEETERPDAVGRAVTPQTAVTLERVLETVVTDGTGRRAAVPGYRVAGKTGTAEKVIPGVGYSPTARMANFVGLVPARRPRLVCLVLIDEPRGLDPRRRRGGAGVRGGDEAGAALSRRAARSRPARRPGPRPSRAGLRSSTSRIARTRGGRSAPTGRYRRDGGAG